MANDTLLSIRSLNLNAADVRGLTGWGETMTNDYLTTLENFRRVATEIDAVIEQVTINAENIEINRVSISDLTDVVNAHISSNSQHGVTGSNVGDEDFCTDTIGGVVNLMALVSDAVVSVTDITTVDLSAAPAAYDQAYTQLQSDLINEEKAKINEIVTDLTNIKDRLNELIANSITAKQMAAI